MPRQSTADPQSEWGQYVARVLKKHALNPRSQRIRTEIPHSTVDGWLRDIPASYPNALKFAQKLGEDVNEALVKAGFEPSPTEATNPREMAERLAAQAQESADAREAVRQLLNQVGFGQHESPRDRYHRRLGELVEKYGALEYDLPAGTRYGTGGELASDEEADQAILFWLDRLRTRNPDKPAPEELEEAE